MSYIKIAEQIKAIERQLEAIQQAKAEKAMSGGTPFKYYSDLKTKRENKLEAERRKYETKKETIEERCEQEIADAKKRRDQKLAELDEKFKNLEEETETKIEEYGKSCVECLNRQPKSKHEIELELKLTDLKALVEQHRKRDLEDEYAAELLNVERQRAIEINDSKQKMEMLEMRREALMREITNSQVVGEDIPPTLVQEAHTLVKQKQELDAIQSKVQAKASQQMSQVKSNTKYAAVSSRIEQSLKQIDEDAKIPVEERIRMGREFMAAHPEIEDMERAWQLERAKLMAQSG